MNENIKHNVNNCSQKCKTCKRKVYQYADISSFIKLNPIVNIIGEITAECCGEPTIISKNTQDCCDHSHCELVVTQTICVTIPIEYQVCANVGKSNINCKDRDC